MKNNYVNNIILSSNNNQTFNFEKLTSSGGKVNIGAGLVNLSS